MTTSRAIHMTICYLPYSKDDKYRRWPKYRVKKTINTENDPNLGHRKDDNVRRWQTIKVQTEDIRFNLIPSLKGTLERTSVQCNFNKILKNQYFFQDLKIENHWIMYQPLWVVTTVLKECQKIVMVKMLNTNI
jgi:lipopolysaccharide assembly outer membrane protein LptD (OstA)